MRNAPIWALGTLIVYDQFIYFRWSSYMRILRMFSWKSCFWLAKPRRTQRASSFLSSTTTLSSCTPITPHSLAFLCFPIQISSIPSPILSFVWSCFLLQVRSGTDSNLDRWKTRQSFLFLALVLILILILIILFIQIHWILSSILPLLVWKWHRTTSLLWATTRIA